MSTESIIIKAIVITLLFMLITLTPPAHAVPSEAAESVIVCREG